MIMRPARGLPLFLCAAVFAGNGLSQLFGPAAEKGVVVKPLGDIDLATDRRHCTSLKFAMAWKWHCPGEMKMATNEISHWWENRGTVPVVLMPVDVFKP